MPSYAIQPGNEALLDQSNLTESYTQAFWRHAKQLAKGAAVLGTGMLGYGLWRYATQQSVSTAPHRDTGELTPKRYDLPDTLDGIVSDSITWDTDLDFSIQRRADHCLSYSSLDEFQINNNPGRPLNPVVAALADGGFVAVWVNLEQNGYGVYGQCYSPSGLTIGEEFRTNNYTIGSQAEPAITGLLNGGFVVVLTSFGQDGSYGGIFGQRFDASGTPVGTEFQVNTYTTNDQDSPAISSLADGSFVVVWQSNGQDGSGYGIYGQRYAISGAPLGSEFQINTYTANDQSYPVISSLTDGNFMVVWQSDGQDGDSTGIYGQRYTIAGTPLGSEFQINSYTTSAQQHPVITALTNGSFIVVWISYKNGTEGVYAQRYGAALTPLGSEFQIYNTYVRDFPTVTSFSDGNFVVVTDMYGQRYNESGVILGHQFQISYNFVVSPAVTSLPGGDFVVIWQTSDLSYFQLDWSIHGQRYVNTTFVDLLNFCDTAYIEDTLLTLKVSLTHLVNEPSQVNMSLSLSDASSGQLGTSVTPAGVTISSNVSSGIWQAYGDTLSGIISALGRLTFSPKLNYNANVTVSAAYSDNFGNVLQGNFLLIGQVVDDRPVWVNNLLPISQGENKILDVTQLLATDVDNTDSELVITVSQVQHGQFEHISQPGIGLTNFTQQNIKSGDISFRHDDLTFAPSFALNVTDGQLSALRVATIDFNLKPSILNNAIVVQSFGEAIPITTSMILATDNDNSPDELVYTVGELQHGHFEIVSNVGKPTTHFTQQDINNHLLRFIHDGSHYPPSYTLTVSDGRTATQTSAASVSFNIRTSNNTPYTQTTGFKAGVSLSTTAVGTLIGFGLWRYQNKQEAKKRRKKSLIGNTIRDELKLSGINDFESENGVQFIEAITVIMNKLNKNHNTDVMQLDKFEQEAFAHQLAESLKPYILESPPEEIMEGGNRVSSVYLSYYYQKIKPMIKQGACWLDTDAVKKNSTRIAEQVNANRGSLSVGATNKNFEMRKI